MTYEKLLLLRWVKLSLLSELRDDTSMDELESCLGSMTDDPDKNPPSLTTPQIIFVITSFFQVFRRIFLLSSFYRLETDWANQAQWKISKLDNKERSSAGEPSFLCPWGFAWRNSCSVRPERALVYCQFFLPTARSSLLIEFQPQMIGYTKNKTEEDHWQSAARSLSKILTVVVGGETAGRRFENLGENSIRKKLREIITAGLSSKFQIDEKTCPLADAAMDG